MVQKLIEHILGIIVVSITLICILFLLNIHKQNAAKEELTNISKFVTCDFIDFNDPFHKALLKDVMNIYYPGQYDKNSKTVNDIIYYREKEFSESLQKSHVSEQLTGKRLLHLLGMYIKFILVYVLVMVLTYYGVQTLGVWRFIRRKQRSPAHRSKHSRKIGAILLTPFKKVVKGIIYFILFSPAYVIAYSITNEGRFVMISTQDSIARTKYFVVTSLSIKCGTSSPAGDPAPDVGPSQGKLSFEPTMVVPGRSVMSAFSVAMSSPKILSSAI